MRTLSKNEVVCTAGGAPAYTYLTGGNPAVAARADFAMQFQEAYPNTALDIGLTFWAAFGGTFGTIVSAIVAFGVAVMDDNTG